MPLEELTSASSTYSRNCEYPGRSSISPVLSKEPLEANDTNIHLPSEPLGTSRRGSLCRSDYQSPATLRELEVRPSGNSHRCSNDIMDSLPELLPEPSTESDSEIASKNRTRAASPGVVPYWPTAIWFPLLTSMALEPPVLLDPKSQTMLGIPSATYPWTNPNWKLSVWKLSGSDSKHIKRAHGHPIVTHNICFSNGLLEPEQVRHSTDLKALLKHSKRIAAPKQLLKPRVDISPTLRFLARILSDTSAPLADLNKKAAFLLAMAAFLRPSDLERISLHHCTMTSQGDLTIKVVAPKEHRAGRRIIKTLAIPVKRPSNKLLVNSKNPSNPLKSTTISTRLRNLLRLSISHKPIPSVRSVASDLALARGAPLTDVITMDFAIRLEQGLADKEEIELIFMSKELSATALMLYKSYLAHSVKEVNNKVIKSLIK
ncbi:hypothetical protein INT44_006111 [Umbelopsis vinacea]|uniref:Uncharacterized protein n=1 Tax=Umbelopsis vinacea TaxID=44442 RepID=A0A8H7PDF2_9FUNG|nr:hypothetical protein INT44_006111 [Umbelopsis vinacea]